METCYILHVMSETHEKLQAQEASVLQIAPASQLRTKQHLGFLRPLINDKVQAMPLILFLPNIV